MKFGFSWQQDNLNLYDLLSIQVALADIRNNPSAVDVAPDLVNIITQIVNFSTC